MKTNSFFSLALTIVFLYGLSACGFQLRGQQELPTALHVLYLQTDTPYDAFDAMLRQSLHAQGVTLVESPQQAPLTLRLSKPEQTNSNTTAGTSSQTRIYTMTYTMNFTLSDRQGKTLLGPQKLITSRNLTLSANQLLESNNQVEITTREMQKDILDQLYHYLYSAKLARILDH